jgi:hypothetical protein
MIVRPHGLLALWRPSSRLRKRQNLRNTGRLKGRTHDLPNTRTDSASILRMVWRRSAQAVGRLSARRPDLPKNGALERPTVRPSVSKDAGPFGQSVARNPNPTTARKSGSTSVQYSERPDDSTLVRPNARTFVWIVNAACGTDLLSVCIRAKAQDGLQWGRGPLPTKIRTSR